MLILFSFFTLIGCKRTISGQIPEGEQELPDMIMHEATYIFGEKNIRPLVMKAETITIFSGDDGRTILKNASFIQEEKDDEGKLYTEMYGSCEDALINSDNTIAKMSGNVKLVKKTDNFSIECHDLEWNDKKQTIKTDSEVKVVYEDGTELKAIGFSAQLDDNIYEFGKIIEGRYSDEK